MSLQLSLSQVQKLKLIMTPELRQSIYMMQLSSYELIQYLQEKATENPLLEVNVDIHFSGKNKKSPSTISSSGKNFAFNNIRSNHETLEENLIAQLRMINLNPAIFKIASYLAGNLNRHGYLCITLSDASQMLDQPPELVEKALEEIQSLDPPGVGARTVRECLSIQIKRDLNADPMILLVVSEYLKTLARGKLDVISKELGVSKDKIRNILHYIRNLNPRPGLMYGSNEQQYIIPDAVVKKSGTTYVLKLNEKHLPTVHINHDYLQLFEHTKLSEVHSFLNEKIRSAQWIMRSLEQRKETLSRVIRTIVAEQRLFFEQGDQGMQPMNLKMISDKLDLHESTVSRAIRNKYIQTPYGTFELKYFFTAGLKTVQGTCASKVKVKNRLRELIEEEDKENPLSDQDIVQKLMKESIIVSRRTVTKYRKEMQILTSSMRKRLS